MKVIFSGSAVVAINPLVAFANNDQDKLLILHTNDIHCHLEAQPQSHPRNGGKGGLYRIAAYVKEMREKNPGLLLFDSGDFSQGTPYFNFFGNEVILKLMSEMQYDAATIGNHEFDNGLVRLADELQYASFPLISSNYDFSHTVLADKIIRNKVIERNNIRIGVYGLGVELEGLVDPSKYGRTAFFDPVEIALEQEEYLRKKEKCDFILCLSHLGYSYSNNKVSDIQIAQNTRYTNLILGGHTHTFLNEPVKEFNKENMPVLINQAGWAALQLGQLEIFFERKQKLFFDFSRNHSF
ncbi:MAG: metallophosphatase [Prolixibacteraceae bacterium]|nr:metallophosphatase [Prolixibacteraceae bacterium]